MKKYLIYNLSGELDDICHLFPNERLGRIAAIIRQNGDQADIVDRANIADLVRLGPAYMKNLGDLPFYESNDLYRRELEAEAESLAAAGYAAVFLNLWHGTGFKFCFDLARELKSRRPGLKIYGVGQKVDWFKEHILALPGSAFDGLLTGLGFDGVRHLVQGGDIATCPSSVFRRADGTISLQERAPVDVDDYPTACYDQATYPGIVDKIPVYTLTLSNQACPSRCTYCIRPENYGRSPIRRRIANVMAELRQLCFERNVHHIRIEDSTPPRGALTELAQAIVASDLNGKLKLSCFSRIDTNRGENFALMRQAGFQALFFGIETLDDENLLKIRKGTTFQGIGDTLKAAHDAGIRTVGSFIFPLPGETRQSMANTLARLRQIRPYLDSLLCLPAAIYPPTEWGRDPERYGFRLDDNYIETFLTYPLKYLLPLKHWPPAPFRYSVMGKPADAIEFSEILDIYQEFMATVQNELKLPFIPDYYYLLADLAGQDSLSTTAGLVQLMINRDYAGVRDFLAAEPVA